MKKSLLSLLVTFMLLALLLPSFCMEIAAASNSPAKLTNPSISPVKQSEYKYTGYYDDEVSASSKFTVKWRDVGQEYFNIAVK